MVKGNIFVPFGTPPLDENRQTELKQGSQALAAADSSEVIVPEAGLAPMPEAKAAEKPRRDGRIVTICVDIGDGDGATSPSE
jgi:hypothetical protein